MKLIIGGAFQGKLNFAIKKYAMNDNWVDGAVCSEAELMACGGVNHFHQYICRMISNQDDVWTMVGKLIDKNPEIVIVTNELGYGVVPVETFDRQYREATGRVCTRLAEVSDEVYRVVCGIGQVIKGA